MEEIFYIVTLETLKYIDIFKLFPYYINVCTIKKIPNTDKVEISVFIEN